MRPLLLLLLAAAALPDRPPPRRPEPEPEPEPVPDPEARSLIEAVCKAPAAVSGKPPTQRELHAEAKRDRRAERNQRRTTCP